MTKVFLIICFLLLRLRRASIVMMLWTLAILASITSVFLDKSFRQELETNFKTWYTHDSEYYQELVDVVGLSSLLSTSGPDLVKKKVFKSSVLEVLNKRDRAANRTYAVQLRLEKLFPKLKYQDFYNIRDILRFIEDGITNVLKPDMIFDNEMLKRCVHELIENFHVRVSNEDFFAGSNDFKYGLMTCDVQLDQIQHYLMDILPPTELYESNSGEDEYNCDFGENYRRAMRWPCTYQSVIQAKIEKRVEDVLLTSYRLLAHESSKIIAEVGSNIGLIFLDDRNFERKVQQAIENAGLEEVQRVRATLEKKLKLWFPTTSENFLNIIKMKKLFWSLMKNGTTSDKDTFEHNLKNILDGDNQVRMKALTLLIDNKLFEDYPNLTNFRTDVLKDMRKSIRNNFKSDLIFDDKMLEIKVQEAVQDYKTKIIQ